MATAGLRQELRHLLCDLQTELHADSGASVRFHRTQAYLAELSSVRNLLELSLRALTGEQLPPDDRFLHFGAIRDAQDAASCSARELLLLREDAEQRCGSLDAPTRAAVALLLRAENEATALTEEHEQTFADAMEAALTTCSREMCDELCRALSAASVSQLAAARRQAIGREAADTLNDIVARWLHWFSDVAPRRQPAVPLPHEALLGEDPGTAEYARQVRRCMHLRRLQARLVSAMRRISAAARVGEACAVLQEKIVFP